jgi:uncharacterized protein
MWLPLGEASAVAVALALLLGALSLLLWTRWRRRHLRRRRRLPAMAKTSGEVVSVLRYAVKGLDPDRLPATDLRRGGGGLPDDRRWALRYVDAPADAIDPLIERAPGWAHKSQFLCAFTAGTSLSHLETQFDDGEKILTVRARNAHATAEPLLLRESLMEPAGRARIEQFFGRIVQRTLKLREGSHFGNTPAGCTKGNGKLHVIHIVNEETIKSVSARVGCDLSPSRFRPNVIIRGIDPWEEFSWVGRRISIGGSVFRVINRTVRCAATRVDRENVAGGDGGGDIDIPAILQREFPEHGPYLGVYAQFEDLDCTVDCTVGVAEATGLLRVGDSICVEAAV